MQNTRLLIGTDSGATHLSATVGTPILAFRTDAGNSRNLFPRMAEVATDFEIVNGWDNPQAVIQAALKRLRHA